MTADDNRPTLAATAKRRLFIFSLWYFPSHFGLHVVDIATAFARAGYDVTIVTVEEAAFALPYFDAFREAFDAVSADWPQLVRLHVDRLEERGAYNPQLLIRRDSTFYGCLRQMEGSPCYLLHFFEMLLPYFNTETVPSALVTSVLYAGNFVTRVIEQDPNQAVAPASPDQVVKTLLRPYSVALEGGGYRLRGVDCIFSETQELVRTLRSTMLRTPCWWTSRPVFAAPVLAAPPCDIRASWNIPRAARLLLYAGRPAKNVRALLSILRLVRLRSPVPPIVLLLIGVRAEQFGEWPGAPELRQSVRTVPFVNRTQLFGIMKSADVFVYPGLVDGYPKVLSEASLARLPIVAFNSPASGVREIAMHEKTALLVDTASAAVTSEPENERFAAAVTQILTEPELRDAIVQRAFAAAEGMDAPRFVSKLEQLWRNLGTGTLTSRDDNVPDSV